MTPITHQAVLAHLKKNGFDVAHTSMTDVRKNKDGVKVKQSWVHGYVDVRLHVPFNPEKWEREFKRLQEVLTRKYIIVNLPEIEAGFKTLRVAGK